MDNAMTVAERCIDAVNRADIDDLIGLFHPGAILAHPAGVFAGTDAIADFYKSVVFAGQAFTEIERQFSDGNARIMQIRASSQLAAPDQYVYAVDVFVVSDNLIKRLDIYYR